MFVKKNKEGGFINPAYEKFERIMGLVTLVVIVCLFVGLVFMAIKDLNCTDTI
ncbi:MAG: hypothetical protein H6Q12_228 [Bacteroidetes bacterium]|nr:hypothetical protein [Bacteroidota bacterium]